VDASLKVRTGGAQWLAEAVAAFGLVATILAGIRFNRPAVPVLVAFTSPRRTGSPHRPGSLNPAVAIARSLTNRFRAFAPVDLPGFIRPNSAARRWHAWS